MKKDKVFRLLEILPVRKKLDSQLHCFIDDENWSEHFLIFSHFFRSILFELIFSLKLFQFFEVF